MFGIRRREFITLIGGAAAAWPLAARAQQPERVRRVGLLVGLAVGDPEVAKYSSELREALRALGWIEGKNLRVDYRAAADLGDMRSLALELANLGSELVVTYSTPAANAVRQAAPWMPIVFTAVSDPIGTGFVESFARPGGFSTGFTNFEASMGSKWLELLRDIAPRVKRAAMLFNPTTANTGASGGIYLPSMQAAAQVLGVQLSASPVSDPAEIDGLFAALAQGVPAGSIVMPNVLASASSSKPHGSAFPQFIRFQSSSLPAACCPMGSIISTSSVARHHMPTVFCTAPSPLTCLSNSRPSSYWSSTSRLQRCLGWRSLRRSSPAPRRL
jgi:putative ABC transport system substrate-binding protein